MRSVLLIPAAFAGRLRAASERHGGLMSATPRPALHGGHEMRAVAVRLMAYLGGLTVLAVIAAEWATSRVSDTTVPPRARSEWVEVTRPRPAFSLSTSELDPLHFHYAIQRHEPGQGRKDRMTWTDPETGAPVARVEIYRPGAEPDQGSAALSAVAALAPPGPTRFELAAEALPTKFDPFTLVDFTIPHGETEFRRCLGFHHPVEQPKVRITGWYCGAGPEIVPRSIVACALDRLALLASGSDTAVAGLFARAELARTFCGQSGPLLAATFRRQDWMEAARGPRLRGALGLR